MARTFASVLLENLEIPLDICLFDTTNKSFQAGCDYVVLTLPEKERWMYGWTNWDVVKKGACIRDNDKIVGFMLFFQDNNPWLQKTQFPHLKTHSWLGVAILPEYRGKGLTKKLYNEIIPNLPEDIKPEIIFWVCTKQNIASFVSAKKLGFKETDSPDDGNVILYQALANHANNKSEAKKSQFRSSTRQGRNDPAIYSGYAQLFVDKVKEYDGKIIAYLRISAYPQELSGMRVISNNISTRYFGVNLKDTLNLARQYSRPIEVGNITLKNRDGYDYAVATIPANNNYIRVLP